MKYHAVRLNCFISLRFFARIYDEKRLRSNGSSIGGITTPETSPRSLKTASLKDPLYFTDRWKTVRIFFRFSNWEDKSEKTERKCFSFTYLSVRIIFSDAVLLKKVEITQVLGLCWSNKLNLWHFLSRLFLAATRFLYFLLIVRKISSSIVWNNREVWINLYEWYLRDL